VIFMISSEPAPMLEDKEKWWVAYNTPYDLLSSPSNGKLNWASLF
jgi:hypothetical protein